MLMLRAVICHHGSPIFELSIFVWTLQLVLGMGTSGSLGNAVTTGDGEVSFSSLRADANIARC